MISSGNNTASANFNKVLNTYLNDIDNLKRLGASEASIRDTFFSFLREAFPGLDHNEPVFLEHYIPAIRVRPGYADALYGDLIFEFKKRLSQSSRDQGKLELERYLLNQEHPDKWFGILTDGHTLEVYVVRKSKLSKNPVDTFCISAQSPELIKLKLDVYLFHERKISPDALDIVYRFGERSPVFQRTMAILNGLWREVKNNTSVKTKFDEWNKLLAIVYGSMIGNDELFLKHTYLAYFARIIAFTALENRSPALHEINSILTGEAFKRMGFVNLAEEDFFIWINDEKIKSTSAELFQNLSSRLGYYYLDQIEEDLLKELYQELVDPATRHDLGEFYTPDWLAELTLAEVGYPPDTADREKLSLFDPACGSGTFLFTAIRLLREKGWKGKSLVKIVLEQFAGVDVHPLAVVIARTNIILALGRDVRSFGKDIILPVYMANSLNIPDLNKPYVSIKVPVEEIARHHGIKHLRKIPQQFTLPQKIVEEKGIFDCCLNILADFAKSKESEKIVMQGFIRKLKDVGVAGPSRSYWVQNLRLLRWLIFLKRDTVWKFVLSNVYRPVFLASRKFYFVVGNPPWLSYRYVKVTDYQVWLRALAFRYKLLSKKQRQLFTQIELATIFYAFCLDVYLKENGKIAFVMPRSVLTGAKQHEGFRLHYLFSAFLVIDCEKVEPLFNWPACVIIGSNGESKDKLEIYKKQHNINTPGYKVCSVFLDGTLPRKNLSWEEAKKCLRIRKGKVRIALDQKGSFYLPKVLQGASLVPRCLWFVKPSSISKVVDKQCPYLETDPEVNRDAKLPWKGIKLSGKVEAEFLFGTLLSKNVVPFGWQKFSLVTLPLVYDANQNEYKLCNQKALIERGKVYMAQWLEEAEKKWERLKKSQFSLLGRLNWGRNLTIQSPQGYYKVIYGASGTHLCACVVDSMEETLKEITIYGLNIKGFVVDTKTYCLAVKNKEEAHYLCAILNSLFVDRAIKAFQTKGSFGAKKGKGQRDIHRRPFEVLPIPFYNTENGLHRSLSLLSQQCHERVRGFLQDHSQRPAKIGLLRKKIREFLDNELKKIDNDVRKLFPH